VLQGLLESLSEGLIVFDREYRYRFWNPFMEKLTGLGADQVLGRRPADLFPHIAEQGVDSMLRRAMAGRPSSRTTFLPCAGDGARRMGRRAVLSIPES